MQRATRYLLGALGAVWTVPNTLIGLVVGAVGMPFGARARWSRQEFAIVFDRWPWGPGGAMTLGNSILNTHEGLDSQCLTYAHRAGHVEEARVRIGDHERAHVYQYMLLGPLFLPLYLLLGGVSVRNPLERAADRYAHTGKGWWPWGTRANGKMS
ncbi:MAG: hypothetical protein IAE66_09335 [Xanthomonadaceae bacterium]|nr:hypothetical protein [Xanthomonadaceae bacterium]